MSLPIIIIATSRPAKLIFKPSAHIITVSTRIRIYVSFCPRTGSHGVRRLLRTSVRLFGDDNTYWDLVRDYRRSLVTGRDVPFGSRFELPMTCRKLSNRPRTLPRLTARGNGFSAVASFFFPRPFESKLRDCREQRVTVVHNPYCISTGGFIGCPENGYFKIIPRVRETVSKSVKKIPGKKIRVFVFFYFVTNDT